MRVRHAANSYAKFLPTAAAHANIPLMLPQRIHASKINGLPRNTGGTLTLRIRSANEQQQPAVIDGTRMHAC